MISCKFRIPSDKLSAIDEFTENSDFSNLSVFENTDLGFSERLDENGFPIAKFFDVEVLVSNNDESQNLKKALEEQFGETIVDFDSCELKNEDWVELYTKELKPVICDKFYFYNDTIQSEPVDSDLIPVKLNSALAFGSGHHQTTQSCLLNARHLNGCGFVPKNILDMGCGTGILGICSLKIWTQARLIGIDIDPEAVAITKENYDLNGIDAISFVGHDLSSVKDKFDLIFSNILKQPLIDLCPEFQKALMPGGYVVTSGFITSQELDVVQCYESFGFEIANRIQMEDWLSIMFRKK